MLIEYPLTEEEERIQRYWDKVIEQDNAGFDTDDESDEVSDEQSESEPTSGEEDEFM